MTDIHYTKTSQGTLQPLFAQITSTADVLLLCGDLTTTGQPDEARVLAKELAASVKVPIVGVLGNHDYEAGKQNEIRNILCDIGVSMLDGETCNIHGVGFTGVKGFAGGFDRCALQAWGEQIIKDWVQETVKESLRLESALSLLQTPQIVVLLHYSPIRATVEGEPPELFPFLGSSRLEEPLNRFQVSAVFHGHAHAGSPEGQTKASIPVYNVSMSVLQRAFPDHPPFRLVEISREPKQPE
jgi:Icc-related predicted phosphoesterase